MQSGVVGTNAVAFKFNKGVIVAVDTSASYGRMALPNIQRVFKATENCVVVFSGLMSEIQFLERFIKEEIASEEERKMDPQGIHKMIQRIMYQKRCEAAPFAVSVIVCGVNEKENVVFKSTDEQGRMIGAVDSKGNFWFDKCVAISFSAHFALPMLREKEHVNLERGEAISLMEEVFKILCYKDCRSSNNIQIAVIEKDKVDILDPYSIPTDWMIGKREDEILIN